MKLKRRSPTNTFESSIWYYVMKQYQAEILATEAISGMGGFWFGMVELQELNLKFLTVEFQSSALNW